MRRRIKPSDLHVYTEDELRGLRTSSVVAGDSDLVSMIDVETELRRGGGYDRSRARVWHWRFGITLGLMALLITLHMIG